MTRFVVLFCTGVAVLQCAGFRDEETKPNLTSLTRQQLSLTKLASETQTSHPQRQRTMIGNRNSPSGHQHLKVALLVVAPVGLANSTPGWRDAFAVLAHSVKKSSQHSPHAYELLAVMPSDIPHQDQERQAFAQLGFEVMLVPIPVPLDQVESAPARQILKGALGQNEELKFIGTSLVEYDRAVVLDADVIFLQPIDELLELTDGQYAMSGVYDHEMDLPQSVFPPLNSGFFVVKPSKEDFDRLVGIYRKGNIGSDGWDGSGTGWTYGTGSQGILSYFYNQVIPGKDGFSRERPTKGADYPGMNWTQQPANSRFLPQDRSVYNVVDTKLLQSALRAGSTSVDRVKVFHFAGGSCPKPWTCLHVAGNNFCDAMTAQWWKFRAEVAEDRGAKVVDMQCRGKTYDMLPS